jgi:uncharacterized protein YjiS (DUF1127 family)
MPQGDSDPATKHRFNGTNGRAGAAYPVRTTIMEIFTMQPGILEAGHGALPAASTSTASTRVAAFLLAARRMARLVWVWRSRAESRRTMSMLSDHVLRDIGVTRADVDREVMKPFWRV